MEVKTSERGFKRMETERLKCGYTLQLGESSVIGEPSIYYGVKEEAFCPKTEQGIVLPFSIERHYHLNNSLLLTQSTLPELIACLTEGSGSLTGEYGNTFEFSKCTDGVQVTLKNPEFQYFDGPSGNGWKSVNIPAVYRLADNWILTRDEVEQHCEALSNFHENGHF